MRWIDLNVDKILQLQNAQWILDRGEELLDLQKRGGVVIGPESYLYSNLPERFDRIISMCSWIEYPDAAIAGMKWISSKASNVDKGMRRGGAVTVLNDALTGFPMLAYDGSSISLARTAMVSCLAMDRLCGNLGPLSMGIVGAGKVHEWQVIYAKQLWPDIHITVFDLNKHRAEEFAEHYECVVAKKWEDCLWSEVFSLATAGPTAIGWIPWQTELSPLMARVWLHTSLRDIQPRLTQQFNMVVVDDHEMAISEGTSYSFAWREGWVNKEISLADLVAGGFDVQPEDYPVLVTPKGLAMWDVGIGYRLLEEEFKLDLEAMFEKKNEGLYNIDTANRNDLAKGV